MLAPNPAHHGRVGFAELRFHLLPGLDDGPETIEQSVELAAAASAEGTRTILATPHVNLQYVAEVDILPDCVAEVSERLRRERIEIQVLLGAELSHERVWRLTQAELETIAQGPRGHRWLLLEAPLDGLDEDFPLAAEELRDRGFAVLVAHPERSLGGSKAAWRIIEQELAAGSAMQVNAGSIAGLYGERVQREAHRLLERTPSVAIASDAHGSARMPALRLALNALESLGQRNSEHAVSSLPLSMLQRGLQSRPAASLA